MRTITSQVYARILMHAQQIKSIVASCKQDMMTYVHACMYVPMIIVINMQYGRLAKHRTCLRGPATTQGEEETIHSKAASIKVPNAGKAQGGWVHVYVEIMIASHPSAQRCRWFAGKLLLETIEGPKRLALCDKESHLAVLSIPLNGTSTYAKTYMAFAQHARAYTFVYQGCSCSTQIACFFTRTHTPQRY